MKNAFSHTVKTLTQAPSCGGIDSSTATAATMVKRLQGSRRMARLFATFAALLLFMGDGATLLRATVVDFETAATGQLTVGATSFTSGGRTWTLTRNMVGDPNNGFGSAPVGASTSPSNGYIDSGFLTSRVAPINVGGFQAPTGFNFRAVSFDIWPSKNQGNDIIPYPGGGNNGSNLDGETGHTFTVVGTKGGVQQVSATVSDRLRTPPQTGNIAGGHWHFLDLSGTAFPTTDIDKIEITLLTQSGNATDGPNVGSPLSTPDYIAIDNFVYTALAANTPAVTVPGGTTTLTTTTSGTAGASVNFSITGANLTGGSGNLTVTAPTNVEVSANNATWGGTALIPYSSATLASTPIYVRLAGTGSVGTISGNLSITGGGLSAAVTQAVSGTLNVAPTTITSLNRVNATPSNGAFVNWTLTFASPVTGLSASNFTLTGAAAAGSSVVSPGTSNSGLTWNVPVTTGSTDGTLTLNLANATGLSQAISTSLPFVGQSYTMDKTQPTILSINRLTPAGQTTGSTSVTFRVTYSEAVTGMTNSSFAVVAVNGSNIVGTVTGLSNITPTSCDVTVNITSGTGEFRLRGVN